MVAMSTVILHKIYENVDVSSNNFQENISMGFKMSFVNIHTAVIHE